MTRTISRKLMMTLAVLLALNTTITAQEEATMPPAAKPGTEHENMAKEAGVWEGEMKMWMAPGQEPMTMPVLETNMMLDGDMWLSSKFESGPFKGQGVFGYDPIKKKYVGTWIDNMTPHLSVMWGDKNDDGELVMYSTGYNPQTSAPEKMKSVAKMVSEDEKTFTMHKAGKGEGEWIKQFEIRYKRKS